MLTTGEKERPIISTLKEIRRALSFGHISTEEAAKEADIALSGLTATAAIEHKLIELSVELQNVILGYEKQIAECRIADAALKQLEEKENQQDEKWREDAQKVAILVDFCETKSIANQQLLNTVFFKTKNSLNEIAKIRTTDSSMSELVKWQDVNRKIGSMSELSRSASSLLEGIKARYKVISLKNNLLET